MTEIRILNSPDEDNQAEVLSVNLEIVNVPKGMTIEGLAKTLRKEVCPECPLTEGSLRVDRVQCTTFESSLAILEAAQPMKPVELQKRLEKSARCLDDI